MSIDLKFFNNCARSNGGLSRSLCIHCDARIPRKTMRFIRFQRKKSRFISLKRTYLDNLVCRHHRHILVGLLLFQCSLRLADFSSAVERTKTFFLHSLQECSLFLSIHLYSKFPTVVTLRYRQPSYSPYIRVAFWRTTRLPIFFLSRAKGFMHSFSLKLVSLASWKRENFFSFCLVEQPTPHFLLEERQGHAQIHTQTRKRETQI